MTSPTAAAAPSTPRRRLAAIAAGLLICLAAAWAMRRSPPPDAPWVHTGPITAGPLEARFLATGEVTADVTTFAPPDWAVVADVSVREGDLVRPGQMLARLGASGMRAQYLQARSAWTAARGRSIEALRTLQMRTAQVASGIDEARADLRAAEARQAGQGSGEARAEADKKRAALAGAIAGKAELQILETQLQTARADLEVKTEALHDASERLRCEEIRAPSDGRVTQVLLQAGQRAGPDRPVLSMVSSAPPWVDAWVSEQEAASVQPHQPVTLRISALGGRSVPGHVSWVAPSLETPPRAQGRFLHIRAAFGRDGASAAAGAERTVPVGVRGGMAVDVDGSRLLAERVTLLPRAAVVGSGSGTWVATVSDGVVRRVPVRIGIATADVLEQLEGPPPGTRIVLEGAEGLREGEPVREQP